MPFYFGLTNLAVRTVRISLAPASSFEYGPRTSSVPPSRIFQQHLHLDAGRLNIQSGQDGGGLLELGGLGRQDQRSAHGIVIVPAGKNKTTTVSRRRAATSCRSGRERLPLRPSSPAFSGSGKDRKATNRSRGSESDQRDKPPRLPGTGRLPSGPHRERAARAGSRAGAPCSVNCLRGVRLRARR